jgi:hypothetical protein
LKADFIFDDGATCDTLLNVGFRLRGNNSRGTQKINKVKFNTFEWIQNILGEKSIVTGRVRYVNEWNAILLTSWGDKSF